MLTWNKVIARLVISALMLGAVVLALLPVGKVAYGAVEQSRQATHYVQQIDSLPDSFREEVATAAAEYNAALDHEMVLQDPWDHEQVATSTAHDAYLAAATGAAAPSSDEDTPASLGPMGSLGRVRVDVVGIDLPIFPDATQESLPKRAGHMYGTSLPVGGESTHTVIAAHSGWPNRLLFDNLVLLEEGDEFVIDGVNGSLRYRVDQIAKVYPDDLSLIQVEGGKDYATLVTCFFVSKGNAPYRLLVRGERVLGDAVPAAAAVGAVGAENSGDATSPEAARVETVARTDDAAAAPDSGAAEGDGQGQTLDGGSEESRVEVGTETREGPRTEPATIAAQERTPIQQAFTTIVESVTHDGQSAWVRTPLTVAAVIFALWLIMFISWVVRDLTYRPTPRKTTTP